MLKSSTGISTNADAKLAGNEAARKSREGNADIKLAFAYSSVSYNQDEMLSGIKEVLQDVPIIGSTSFTGIITEDGYVSGEDGFLGIFTLSGSDLEVGVAGSVKNADAREIGQKVAREAMKNAGKDFPPDYFFMTASPGEEEFYLKGITDVIGRVPVFGGSAADNTISGEWKLFTDKASFADGVCVAFFYTKSDYANVFTGAYRETSDVGIITKVIDNRMLMEIDGVPAVEKYASWRGVKPESLLGNVLLSETVTSPLGVKDRLGDLVAIRHPMFANDDFSMNVGANLAENTAVIRMEATVDELILAVGETLDELKLKLPDATGYHLVHCGGRRAGIDNRIQEVVDIIKSKVDNVPFIVSLTFGEYGYADDGNNTTGGLMLSFTAFK